MTFSRDDAHSWFYLRKPLRSGCRNFDLLPLIPKGCPKLDVRYLLIEILLSSSPNVLAVIITYGTYRIISLYFDRSYISLPSSPKSHLFYPCLLFLEHARIDDADDHQTCNDQRDRNERQEENAASTRREFAPDDPILSLRVSLGFIDRPA